MQPRLWIFLSCPVENGFSHGTSFPAYFLFLPRSARLFSQVIHIVHTIHKSGALRIYAIFRQIDYFFLKTVMI